MSEIQFAIMAAGILWGGFLIFLLLRGSAWHRHRVESGRSPWPVGIHKTASVWMLILAIGICCMISLVLLNLVPD